MPPRNSLKIKEKSDERRGGTLKSQKGSSSAHKNILEK